MEQERDRWQKFVTKKCRLEFVLRDALNYYGTFTKDAKNGYGTLVPFATMVPKMPKLWHLWQEFRQVLESDSEGHHAPDVTTNPRGHES